MKPICSVPRCDRESWAKGLCNAHGLRLLKSGDGQADKPLKEKFRGSATERFWPRVNKTATCWLWTGGQISTGYGIFNAHPPASPVLAHRFAYEDVVGPIPEGLHLDHLCRVPLCVNPTHLEPVTNAENVRRGLRGVLKPHCSRGHELTEDNLYRRPGKPNQKRCRTCWLDFAHESAARKKAVHG